MNDSMETVENTIGNCLGGGFYSKNQEYITFGSFLNTIEAIDDILIWFDLTYYYYY